MAPSLVNTFQDFLGRLPLSKSVVDQVYKLTMDAFRIGYYIYLLMFPPISSKNPYASVGVVLWRLYEKFPKLENWVCFFVEVEGDTFCFFSHSN